MIANIYCPGPSLANVVTRPAGDLHIAVNRAAERFECEWWVAGDIEATLMFTPIGRPFLFTCQNSVNRHRRMDVPDKVRAMVAFETPDIEPPRTRFAWSLYSGTAAVALAYHLGGRVIRLYGCDLAGTADYTGDESGHGGRKLARWQREREMLDRLAEWLTEHGATLEGLP